MTQENQNTAPAEAKAFLLNGARFKLDFDKSGRCAVFHWYAKELQGQWVALVDATDNQHLNPAPATADAEADGYIQTVPDHCDRIIWRNSYYHLPMPAAAEADKRDAVQEALEGLALIFEARAIAPFPQTGSRDLRGFAFSQEWNLTREADKNSAAIVRTYAQNVAAQKEAGR